MASEADEFVLACRYNKEENVEAHINAEGDLNLLDVLGQGGLHLAAEKGHVIDSTPLNPTVA